jgi:hypothetical protein
VIVNNSTNKWRSCCSIFSFLCSKPLLDHCLSFCRFFFFWPLYCLSVFDLPQWYLQYFFTCTYFNEISTTYRYNVSSKLFTYQNSPIRPVTNKPSSALNNAMIKLIAVNTEKNINHWMMYAKTTWIIHYYIQSFQIALE